MTLDASGNLLLGTTSRLVNYGREIVVQGTAGEPESFLSLRGSRSSTDQNIGAVTFYNDTTQIAAIIAMRTSANNSGALRFITSNAGSNAERARITSEGNLQVGASSGFGTSARLNVVGNSGQSFAVAFDKSSAGAATSAFSRPDDGAVAIFYRAWAGGGVGSIAVTSTTTAYNTSSDYRLKNTIAPMTGALARVAALKPCTYKWNADGSDGEGFIAHELAEVVPQCVTGEKDAVDSEGKPKYQGIDTSFLVATLTAAIQEQQALIQTLTARVTALEGAQP
jgi:hypothetical protein